jgi:SNF2 family DNA or RNA helicase
MGLGKTVQTLAFLLQERAAGRAEGPSLVVCPTSVVRNWHDEAARFAPDLRVLVHHGADRPRGKALRAAVAGVDLVLTSYPLLRSDAAALEAIEWHALVLDEAQQIKNPDTAQARAARQLRAQVRLALTGTPIENRLDELWSIVEFLNPGYLGTRSAFRTRLALPIEREGDPQKSATLRRLVRPLVLRRLKSDRGVIDDLPDKVVQPAWVHLSEEQASLYQSVVDESLREVDRADGIARKGLVLKMLTSLKQVCNHPAHALGERPGAARSGCSARRGRADRRGDAGALGAPQPQARAPLRAARRGAGRRRRRAGVHPVQADGRPARRAPRRPLRRRGAVPARRRPHRAPRRARAGLPDRRRPADLPAVAEGRRHRPQPDPRLHVFHYDRWWNPAVEDQATDRAYRIGQRKGVQVHAFVTVGTLEERIAEMIEDKRALAGEVIATGDRALVNLDGRALRDLVALRREALA